MITCPKCGSTEGGVRVQGHSGVAVCWKCGHHWVVYVPKAGPKGEEKRT